MSGVAVPLPYIRLSSLVFLTITFSNLPMQTSSTSCASYIFACESGSPIAYVVQIDVTRAQA